MALFRTGIFLAIALVVGCAAPAQAQWLKAESPRFAIYSDAAENDLRRYAQELETFESLLRALHGLPMRGVPDRPLDLYLVRHHASMKRIRPNLSDSIAGFYTSSTDTVFAIGVHGRERNARATGERENQDQIMRHEYVHHFMLQHFPYGYPGWLVEGYADYFMTANILPDAIEVGHISPARASWLGRESMPLERVLSSSAWSFKDREDVARFYAKAWHMTHYMVSDPDRYKQLIAYMGRVAEGGDPVKAMEEATGRSIAELERELRGYQRLTYRRYPTTSIPRAEVAVRRLAPGEEALVLEDVRLRLITRRAESDDLLNRVRDRAGRHPDDLFARKVLARAEIRLGDAAAGEQTLRAILADHPDDVDALQLLAARLGERSDEADPEQAQALRQEANALLARAYGMAPKHYPTLLAIARTSEPLSDNSAEAYLAALEIAPQVGALRMEAASVMLARGDLDHGEHLLQPLIHSPHAGSAAAAARRMIERARAGGAPTLIKVQEGEEDEVDEDAEANPPAS